VDFDAHLARADGDVKGILGGSVTYTTGAGVVVPVRGVFDSAYVLSEAGEAGVRSCGPAVFLLLADLPSDPRTDEPGITRNGTQYRVREVKPDGLGGVLLVLHEA
jgi:hypothetical protein